MTELELFELLKKADPAILRNALNKKAKEEEEHASKIAGKVKEVIDRFGKDLGKIGVTDLRVEFSKGADPVFHVGAKRHNSGGAGRPRKPITVEQIAAFDAAINTGLVPNNVGGLDKEQIADRLADRLLQTGCDPDVLSKKVRELIGDWATDGQISGGVHRAKGRIEK